jgi:hypothetical protein
MEGDSRSLRQLHDSAANSSEDLELSLFRPSHNIIGAEPRLILLLTSLNKHACTMKHLPNPTRANKDSVPTSRRVWNSNLSKFSRYTTLPPRPLESNPPTPSRNMLRRYSIKPRFMTVLLSTGGRNQDPHAVSTSWSYASTMASDKTCNGYEYTHECDFETSIDQLW